MGLRKKKKEKIARCENTMWLSSRSYGARSEVDDLPHEIKFLPMGWFFNKT